MNVEQINALKEKHKRIIFHQLVNFHDWKISRFPKIYSINHPILILVWKTEQPTTICKDIYRVPQIELNKLLKKETY